MKFLLTIEWLDSSSFSPQRFFISRWETFQPHRTVIRLFLVDHTYLDFDLNEIKTIYITPDH